MRKPVEQVEETTEESNPEVTEQDAEPESVTVEPAPKPIMTEIRMDYGLTVTNHRYSSSKYSEGITLDVTGLNAEERAAKYTKAKANLMGRVKSTVYKGLEDLPGEEEG